METGGGNINAQPSAQNPPPSPRGFWALLPPWISVPRTVITNTAWKSAHPEHAYLKTISGLFLCPQKTDRHKQV